MPKSYDKTIRSLLKDLPIVFLSQIIGRELKKEELKLLDVKLQKVIEREADLILEDTKTGEIYHIEFQTTNDREMPTRMALYFYLIYQNYKKAPKQYLVYIGSGECRMDGEVRVGEDSYHRYKVIDLKRDIECEKLLESEDSEDWVLSVLCRIDSDEKIKRLIRKIGSVRDERKRQELIQKVLILSGLRGARVLEIVEREVRKMGLVITPENNVYLRRLRDEWIREGREEGLKEGLERGLKEGLERGKKEGLKEGKLEAAKRLYLKMNLSPEQIAQVLELPLETVQRLVEEIEES